MKPTTALQAMANRLRPTALPRRRRRPPAGRQRRRHGMFLILVLIVVMIATMAVYSFAELMLAYDESVQLTASRVQCDLAVESGGEATRLILAEPRTTRDEMGGVLDNPALFRGVNIVPGTSAVDRVNFTIVAPNLDETGQFSGVRFGLQNESARLNINTLLALEENSSSLMPILELSEDASEDAGEEMDADNIALSLLMALPGMTVDAADSILDWLDEDDEPRDYGAESEYYQTLTTPYAPKNGPIDSIEELLLVKGVTPQLLFGVDANRNGVVDVAEQQYAAVDAGSASSLGWSAYLTVHGVEGNFRDDGTARINVNQDDLELLYAELSEALGNDDWASFIAAYRVSGEPGATLASAALSAGAEESDEQAETPETDGVWTAAALADVDLSGGGGTTITQLLDLVDATITIGNGDNQQVLSSPFLNTPVAMAVYMPALMGNLTTQEYERLPGRINLNECPAELLYGIPLLDEETTAAIIEARAQDTGSENRRYETWPLVEGLVTIDQMRMLMPLLTGGGDAYRAQIIGYYEKGNLYSRAEVIIDATTINPDLVLFRDLSHLGRGFDIAVLGAMALDVAQ
ncbi:type II secretion system minor pseudopilin [Roseimaritima ulvae]|uniref:General secretion pathway protein K n=1 Tax=Roseimaritima ulvae TaxID=980254 RepID=A0A5B9QR89_9BACT|nr:type II secretion system protein GspK [Roseimaritima ulvae]QEG41538.1 General secretion pathway protein K [Roseimaritima ulvae]